MKLLEIADVLRFRTDNPGGEWLKGHHDYNNEMGRDSFGGPARFGSITGYFSRNVLLPVKIVSNLPGRRGEHYKTRQDDLNWLLDFMEKNNTLPYLDDGKRPYVPFIQVWQDGSGWFNEGNHRVKAAKILGWKYIPVELKYYSGGEDVDGLLSPEKVKVYDAQAIYEGYLPSTGFIGIP